MPSTYYPAIIDRSRSGYGVTFPDFPGCIAAGATVAEAAQNAEAALALHVEGMVKDKDALPAPSDLDGSDLGGDICVYIGTDVPLKTERVLISLDAGLLRAIDGVASNRSAWMADAAREKLAGVAAGILAQGELATKNYSDLEDRYGLKPKSAGMKGALAAGKAAAKGQMPRANG